MVDQSKLDELARLRTEVARLESEIAGGNDAKSWAPKGYYTTYHILAGMILGLIGAASSLLFNIVGAAMVGKHPLELIRVYLTFPMGESALTINSGFVLASGCCLYLGTGMFGGIPFHVILSRYFASAGAAKRFLVASLMGIGVWLINYYAIISWLQPALIGGNWIVERIPVVVAALTHLVFAWTLLLVDQWGRFNPPETATRKP